MSEPEKDNAEKAGIEEAWIEWIDDRSWEGELGERHASLVDPAHGRVDHIMSIHSLDPTSMDAHHTLYRQAMAGTATLRKVEREMIALVVSDVNSCHY